MILKETTMSETNVIHITDLTKKYKLRHDNITILDNANLSVNCGEFIVIAGPSGSGKTTLLSLLAGLDPNYSGSIIFCGKEIKNLSLSARTSLRSSHIGMIFQDYRLLPQLTAIENVEAPLHLQDLNRNDRSERAKEALALVGLEARLNHKPMQMSGGEKQRVSVARAIAAGANLLLCDEPTGNLNSDMSVKIFSLLKRLCDNHNKTILLATHDKTAFEYAYRLVNLESGALRESSL